MSVEDAYRRAERAREVPLETKVFRGKVGVLLALQVSLLLAASTFAVDLRRLQDPQAAARAWAEATLAGDCDRARALSSAPARPLAQPGPALVCTDGPDDEQARGRLLTTAVDTAVLREGERQATVVATVTREGLGRQLLLVLRRDGRGWRVVRDAGACALGCPPVAR